ncbi:matrixin family metalloprotease [Streptomyces sp. NPDC002073]
MPPAFTGRPVFTGPAYRPARPILHGRPYYTHRGWHLRCHSRHVRAVRQQTTRTTAERRASGSTPSNLSDIRSVGTHEAGHVFGMGHVGSGHNNLTMYTNSYTCSTRARTLGKGDILGLRSIY